MKGFNPRMLATLLLAAGAVGVLVLSFRPSRIAPSLTPPEAPRKEWAPLREAPAPVESEEEPQYPHGPEEAEPAAGTQLDRNEARPEAGTGEAYLAHAIASVVHANADALELNPGQQQQLVEDFLEFQEIHAELAVHHLQEAGFDGQTLAARVPPFLSEGRALRDLFHERLRRDFPAAHERITDVLGAFFDEHFRGYGSSEQTFTITPSPQHPEAFQVEWQAQPVEGAGAAGAPYAGGSGLTVYSRDQIEHGELRFLAALIERRFPKRGGG